MENSKDIKNKVRKSKEWARLRKELKEQRRNDEITLKPLRKGWNLHHLDLDINNYSKLDDLSHFACLNVQTHEVLHVLYRYYKKDKHILIRLKYFLDEMEKLNK